MNDILTIIGRTVGSAVGKTIGEKFKAEWDRNRLNAGLEAAMKTQLHDDEGREAYIYSVLTTSQAKVVQATIESGHLDKVFQRLVIAQFLGTKKRSNAETAAGDEFRETLRLECELRDVPVPYHAINAVLRFVSGLVSVYLIETDLAKKAPKDAVAQMIPEASLRVSAGERNASILKGLANLAIIGDFSERMRQQVRRVHGKIRLPSTSGNRLVPFDDLYVQPDFVDLGDALESNTRIVVLGDPGGGKSTLAQSAALDFADASRQLYGRTVVPFLVILRDFVNDFTSNKRTMIQHLEDLCRTPYNIEPPDAAIEHLMLNGQAVLIL